MLQDLLILKAFFFSKHRHIAESLISLFVLSKFKLSEKREDELLVVSYVAQEYQKWKDSVKPTEFRPFEIVLIILLNINSE